MINKIPQHLAIFPISFVEEVTNLSGRQIRYYEEQGLIQPVRNKGNQRIFSLNDIERLSEIKSLIDQKVNIAGIKAIITSKVQKENVIIKDDVINSFSRKELEDILVRVQNKGNNNENLN
ncbi:MerR family transcriptional regulator [Evansella cellulosilytica]|uniref:Transcriptional regulator, MerR family n=1 Tax=Evansella cellulosilytica (strain ATCC 21833 / DSM 2522 / FERM P-1141 / JCM 9156 / N-4) TaxID=649639 RepID=E6U0W5_EVAC2|nr:MerR family transcriptional regulator [Evansella cellulosilytica]ADU30277.1 transcriptional regulator, MerR family [Evansella cellulosilytica DSM 2522]